MAGETEDEKVDVKGETSEGRSEDLRYLFWYDVPFKCGSRRRAIAFNWNYKPKVTLSAEKIYKSFPQPRDADYDAVKIKIKETIRFYEYSQRVDQLCSVGLKKALPVPDLDYVLSELVK